MAIPTESVANSSQPALYAVAVTPHDTTNLSSIARALYIGTSGNVVAVMPDDAAVTFKNVSAGTILPVRAKRVNSSSTTAADIVALF